MFETWYKMSAMLTSGLDVSPVLTHRFPAEDYLKAFDVMRSGQSGKVVLDWSYGGPFQGEDAMFEGFELQRIDTAEATIRVRHGGSGPPLLLLHGHPQTHVMWHLVAPRLAREFSVVAMDLRGYGESSKPATTPTTSLIPSARWRGIASR